MRSLYGTRIILLSSYWKIRPKHTEIKTKTKGQIGSGSRPHRPNLIRSIWGVSTYHARGDSLKCLSFTKLNLPSSPFQGWISHIPISASNIDPFSSDIQIWAIETLFVIRVFEHHFGNLPQDPLFLIERTKLWSFWLLQTPLSLRHNWLSPPCRNHILHWK